MSYEFKYSLMNVHVLSKQYNIHTVANMLNESTHMLKRFIARFALTDADGKQRILNFNTLSRMGVFTSEHPFWTAYTKINGGTERNIAKMTMRELHAICRMSDTVDDCANASNIWTITLQKWLDSKFSFTTQNRFEFFRKMTDDVANSTFLNEYDQPIQVPCFTIENKTLYHIHKELKNNGTLVNFCKSTQIKIGTLTRFLKQFSYLNGAPLNSRNLGHLSFIDAKKFFEELYGIAYDDLAEQLKTQTTDLSNKSLEEVHKVVGQPLLTVGQPLLLASGQQQIDSAAKKLNVDKDMLKRFLARFRYINQKGFLELLTFNQLVNMTESTARGYFGDEYGKINGGKIPILENFSYRQFHQLSITAKSLTALADQLNISDSTIMTAINKCSLQNRAGKERYIEFEFLKNLSIAAAEGVFEDLYNETIGSVTIAKNNTVYKTSDISFFGTNKRTATTSVHPSTTNNKHFKLSTDQDDEINSNVNNESVGIVDVNENNNNNNIDTDSYIQELFYGDVSKHFNLNTDPEDEMLADNFLNP